MSSRKIGASISSTACARSPFLLSSLITSTCQAFLAAIVGVDIFFVISGYLIIGQVTSSVAAGKFSFYQFYARRILRILPPFFLVSLATMCAGLFGLLFGFELERLGLSGMAAATMAANVYFFFTSGYFAARATAEPFLHTWTLSVEEQFYLGAPMFIVGVAYLAARAGRRSCAPGHRDGNRACRCRWRPVSWRRRSSFPLPSTCRSPVPGSSPPVACLPCSSADGFACPNVCAPYAAWAGMALMLLAIVGFSDDTAFPGWAAVVPVLGAVLVLAAGVSHRKSMALRLLATRPAILIGLASYSWYLWHWPLLYLARTWFGSVAWIDFAAACLSLLLAFATYFALETTSRTRSALRIRLDLPLRVSCLAGSRRRSLSRDLRLPSTRIGESQVLGAAGGYRSGNRVLSSIAGRGPRAPEERPVFLGAATRHL